eukprot:3506324-Amphidinium_carterae.1
MIQIASLLGSDTASAGGSNHFSSHRAATIARFCSPASSLRVGSSSHTREWHFQRHGLGDPCTDRKESPNV